MLSRKAFDEEVAELEAQRHFTREALLAKIINGFQFNEVMVRLDRIESKLKWALLSTGMLLTEREKANRDSLNEQIAMKEAFVEMVKADFKVQLIPKQEAVHDNSSTEASAPDEAEEADSDIHLHSGDDSDSSDGP